MQRKQIQTLAVACGAAFSITAMAAEPPAPEGETESGTVIKCGFGTGEKGECHTAKGDEAKPCTRGSDSGQSTGHKDCEGSEETSECEAALYRTDKAEFLLGSHDSADKSSGFKPSEDFKFADGFFDTRPDPMTLRPMFSSELLDRFDADGDGSLSGQEQTTTEVFLTARSEQHKDAMLERFDLNKDAQLSENEKVEARQWLFHEQTEMLNGFVEKFDADKDGFLNQRETAAGKESQAEMFFAVSFFEGMTDSFTYRDGPELAREHAEAIETESESLAETASATQQGFLDSIFTDSTHSTDSPGEVAEADTEEQPD